MSSVHISKTSVQIFYTLFLCFSLSATDSFKFFRICAENRDKKVTNQVSGRRAILLLFHSDKASQYLHVTFMLSGYPLRKGMIW